jgi:23S rRNA pseudouridine1911/1915/1917 synthase
LAVAAEDAGTRLDKYLAVRLTDLSRTQIQRLVQEGRATAASGPLSASYRVREGETIGLCVPPPRPSDLAAEPLTLNILYEDDDLLVIDKPAGLVVHPAPGHRSGTLVNALLHHCRSLSGIGGEERPGIIHRLDKDTSGLLVVAKHDRSHRHLAAQLKTRKLQRRYQALVHGAMPAQEGTINAPVGRHPTQRKKMAVVARGGRAARTHYRVLESWGALSLLELVLETGRTHQIRVHLASLGHAVLGDAAYGPGARRWPGKPALEQAMRTFPRQALHAAQVRFRHPTHRGCMTFSSPIPTDMAALVAQLRRLTD